MASVILFDVNETLLDMAALDPHFLRAFGEARARTEWFSLLKEAWLVTIVTGEYVDFTRLAHAALDMTAQKRGTSLATTDEAAIMAALEALPAHPDAAEALSMLRSAGLRLASLSNSTLRSTESHLRHAGLAGYFEVILSVDEVRRYKPAREAYAYAAERLGVPLGEIRLVAAHGWDIAGAAAAGCATAFVARPGQPLNPAGTTPDMQAPDLIALARKLV